MSYIDELIGEPPHEPWPRLEKACREVDKLRVAIAELLDQMRRDSRESEISGDVYIYMSQELGEAATKAGHLLRSHNRVVIGAPLQS